MTKPKIPIRTFRIHKRQDGRFEVRNDNPNDSALGVDASLGMAIGAAVREGMLASREGVVVVIEAEGDNGKWRVIDRIEPPKDAHTAR
jgi:hypothetical protein